ncbi:MAG: toll/interleukin-1 receptor domain-containing protein [Anaerolineales bacterium]|nr:toll/interleukin-1 receptor domain-containing protein [Chloroflexota bacterium]MBL6982523.1 toll/interleukin-1 receptor domain-containing protein [Anaerolineales bacterium]
MAKKKQIERLRRSAIEWNTWRRENPTSIINLDKADLKGTDLKKVNLSGARLIQANFRGADLTEANLSGANLFQANLEIADLSRANLISANLSDASLNKSRLRATYLDWANISGSRLNGANFSGAKLKSADLSGVTLIRANLSSTNLSNANLSEALLQEANLSQAYLSKANLRKANLIKTNLRGANLREAILTRAELGGTSLGDIDLGDARDLENVLHMSPSTIGTDTVQRSKGKIPEGFLKGCGLSDVDIEYTKLANPDLSNDAIMDILYRIHDLRATQAIQFSPLFISYSHADGLFVDQMETHLNGKGIRFWRDVHEMKAGRVEKQIDRAIRQNPTVLLILSKHSIESDWVEDEVQLARDIEKELKRDVICPIALDDSWMNARWPRRLMRQIKEYMILDFSMWEDQTMMMNMFNKLVKGLEIFYAE